MALQKTYVSQSKIHNAERGVFAYTDIETGETIESCPIIEIPKHQIETIGNSILANYVYFFGKNKERSLLALGLGSIFNHNHTPNAVYKINAAQKKMEFISSREIKKDEEITVNYVQGGNTKTPLWFEV